MRFVLEVLSGPRKGRVYPLEPARPFVVGRSRFAQCAVPEDEALSRDHFQVEVREGSSGEVELRDLESTNGTFVNKSRVDRALLKAGDRIRAGESEFALGAREEPESESESEPEAEADAASSIGGDEGGGKAGAGGGRRLLLRCGGCHAAAPERVALATRARLGVGGGSGGGAGSGSGSVVGEGSILWLCERCRARVSVAPQPIPGYTLLRKLGRGAMGVVYLARRDANEQAVALKLIIPEVATTRSAVERFGREVDVLKRLRHPNIVEFLDHGVSDGRLWFAMEYVNGSNLEGMAKPKPGEYPVERACRLMAQVLRGLEHAHALGIVHRDIKPENILLGRTASGSRIAKISDFGLAKCYRNVGFSGVTFSGELRGTIPFLPPEQVLDFRSVLPSADLYATAATLYYLLSGRPLYDDLPEDANEMVRVLLEEPPTPIARHRPDIPPELAAVLTRGLARKPADRYPDARAFREALRPFCEARPGGAG